MKCRKEKRKEKGEGIGGKIRMGGGEDGRKRWKRVKGGKENKGRKEKKNKGEGEGCESIGEDKGRNKEEEERNSSNKTDYD